MPESTPPESGPEPELAADPPPSPEVRAEAQPTGMPRPVDQRPVAHGSVASPPSRPLTPPAPTTAFDNLLTATKNWFMGGNTVVRAGIVVLFFGLAFLLKYAYEHAHVPPELRITGVALGGVALLVLGWRLRLRREGYAWALQGGGVGVLYLTIFAALRLYQLLPPKFAFGLLLCIAILSAVLAVLQNAQALAILWASGGFLAPVLASTGEGSHVMLFGYYALLNAGILGVAWFKAWRPLNLTGFLFTFGIGLAWGAKYYRPEFFATTQPFLIIFFSMYLGVSVLFALRQAPRLKHYLDSTLVFGLPIVAFGMQTRLVTAYEYGAAISALCVGFAYLILARGLHAKRGDILRALVESFLALGSVFATIAIPMALDGRWTSAAWALEGAALLWWASARKDCWRGPLACFCNWPRLVRSSHASISRP
ncbi:MAG: DUF2339 domain-containing protein [Betaproteobacteria bacterium]|nr:DUF2339 domain-containing protein [Betaproteobacteria bacterium]